MTPMDESVSPRRDELPLALLAYAVALALFLLVPPFLKQRVGPPEGFTLQEATDLLTPLVVIPLAWLVFHRAGRLGRPGFVLFLVAAVAWVDAHGIHLAANAIGDAFPPGGAAAFYQTVPGDLDYWLDETLSHWLWHLAWVALSVLVIAAATRSRRSGTAPLGATSAAAGFLHGATFFFVTVEGVTTALGIPWSILLLAWSVVAVRRRLARRPVVVFFLVTAVVTLSGYLAWGALNGWTLPEFSAKGLLG